MAAVVYVRVEQTVDGLLMGESAEVPFNGDPDGR